MLVMHVCGVEIILTRSMLELECSYVDVLENYSAAWRQPETFLHDDENR
jgi:hypothetical protein